MQKAPKPKCSQTLICLSPQLLSQLDAQAQREGNHSRSAIIRRACLEYLAKYRDQFEREEQA